MRIKSCRVRSKRFKMNLMKKWKIWEDKGKLKESKNH